MNEEWKEIENYSRYRISNLGNLWDTKLDREVAKQLTGEPQYYYVNMQRDDGERKLPRLHRLVAMAFVEGWGEELDVVDHIDRNKLNNRFDNLRWTDHKGNFRNLENNIWVGGVFLLDFVQKYENPQTAYAYISQRYRDSSVEEAISAYDEYLEYGHYRTKVDYEGKEYYLIDLVKEKGVDYELARNRLNQGLPVWNAVHGIPVGYVNSFEIPENGVMYWYPHKTYWCALNKRTDDVLRKGLEHNWSTEQTVNSDGFEDLRQTVRGVTGTIKELCAHFEMSEGAVSTNMTRKGMTLEEALLAPRQRVKRLSVNGVYNSPKYWYESFDIDAKEANTYKSKYKKTFKETFEHFGVDTSEMVISLV